MSCTPNHLLIELGVSRRKLGHFVMEGRDKMEKCMICDLPAPDNDDWHSHHEELDRLRAVNAKLLKSLEWALPRVSMAYARPADSINYREAREAIEEARK